MNWLDTIVAHKKRELIDAKKCIPLEFYQSQIGDNCSKYSLLKTMKQQGGFHFIGEVKRASPSRGIIKPDFDPLQQAKCYVKGGASAISVLTDSKFFMGKLDDLRVVREQVDLPLLRKDFIIEPYQIYESRYYLADIVLLIARILSAKQIAQFCELAAELALEVLLELATENDVVKIPSNHSNLILAINNRDLANFEMDLNNSFRLKSLLPDDVPVISASGISNADECVRLFQSGFAGALIGESLMRDPAPDRLLKKFRSAVANAG
ncbi:MAG TPA: indole-3-glycerol phosphate synthase TrpC [Candidatus Marinimicrobia bacterium]|nr:indole-3-glycerol phosphate synthase TrpC [Candidatus Neomarinimicrobiota bacterium]HRS50951.1 indole-3-glycerol phosphate synthase TrpC [Candidatus Neomarinimicrobiota bacterium]HRU91707.1 indole-3-glycerol phosphate synthase TrpC [Candidatus Neomarinimicrobiota bacterium]